ncbi:hypothetical protein M413DRAFT_6631 [Hebeloma cylindrosporum]|uniref:Uncharacterized protein n=1 Tax=Hebeloma cylindrosporum TaxID=76867 RepID=A0A0C2YIX2_HEBCY|nr:hypothetical protein M413DRAFT_6631 [Hebeloma cylindrosporum h7]
MELFFAYASVAPGKGPDEGVLLGMDTILMLLDGSLPYFREACGVFVKLAVFFVMVYSRWTNLERGNAGRNAVRYGYRASTSQPFETPKRSVAPVFLLAHPPMKLKEEELSIETPAGGTEIVKIWEEEGSQKLCERLLFGSYRLQDAQSVVVFTEEELKGVPKDVISGYTKRTEGDKEFFDITFKTPDIFPVFKFAENPETRKKALEDRLKVNVPLLDKALEVRRKISSLLGYKTWYGLF